jgi:phosphate/sulfate permease
MHGFRAKKLEWISSLIILGIGIVMLAYPVSFDLPTLVAFKQGQMFWTMTCLLVGVFRVLALTINGNWPGGTPALRLVGSLIGAGIFGAFVGNLWRTTDATHVYWGMVTYGGLMVGELLSSYYSAKDIVLHKRYGA